MFENRGESLAPKNVFIKRVVTSFLIAFSVVIVALGFGTCGYHYLENLNWIDALLNAAMILGGMGPVDPVKTVQGKLFATFYCLFSGIIFLTLLAIILTPIYHRFLHSFHLMDDRDKGESD